MTCPRCGGDLTAEMTAHGDPMPLFNWCLTCGHRWPRYTLEEDPGLHHAGLRAIDRAPLP
jgi:hypothetical protein